MFVSPLSTTLGTGNTLEPSILIIAFQACRAMHGEAAYCQYFQITHMDCKL